MHILKQLYNQLCTHTVIVTQAHKGKMLSLSVSACTNKKSILPLQVIISFYLSKDPTGICQKQIQQVLQKYNVLFDKHKITYPLQTNPSPPKFKAQLKIHKDDIPICPVVSYRNMPAYKLVHFLQKLLSEHLNHPNEFITPNSMVLTNTLTNLNIMDEYRLLILDTEGLCVSVPTEQILHITKTSINLNNTENAETRDPTNTAYHPKSELFPI